MRFAFFNWRDINNPLAGGAEVYVHQLMRQLIRKGHDAALFTSSFPGSQEHETIDGITHIRYAGRYMIYPKASLCYDRHIRGKFDLICESISGVPFFTPLFAKEPTIALIHQLTRENWYSALPAPIAFAGYHTEDLMLRPYAKRPAIAPSESTKSDLERIGFRDVHVIYGAAEIKPPLDAVKESAPTLIYLGRLTKSKRVDHAILALKKILENVPDARLWIAGIGPEEKNLRQLAKSLDLEGDVRFFGKVGEIEKAQLLSKAHLMLLPAVREGWGLVVLEANQCNTPVVGYRVPGLIDSIREGINGALVESGDYNKLASRSIALLQDSSTLARLSASSSAFSKKFSWERAADEFIALARSAL